MVLDVCTVSILVCRKVLPERLPDCFWTLDVHAMSHLCYLRLLPCLPLTRQASDPVISRRRHALAWLERCH